MCHLLKAKLKFYERKNMKNITDMFLENERLIYKIISKYKNYFDLEDLYQVAAIGLVKAYKNYDNSYDVKFTSYAYPYILGEVIKYINEYRNIRVNRQSRVLYTKMLHFYKFIHKRFTISCRFIFRFVAYPGGILYLLIYTFKTFFLWYIFY